MSDPRLERNVLVNAKATAVTSASHCQKLFGSNWKEGWFQGVVQSSQRRREKAKTKTMNRWYVTVRWACDFALKDKEMLLQNIKAAPFPIPKGGIPERQIESAFPYELAALNIDETQRPSHTSPAGPAQNSTEEGAAAQSHQATEVTNGITSAGSTPGATGNSVETDDSDEYETGAHGVPWFPEDISGSINFQLLSVNGRLGVTVAC